MKTAINVDFLNNRIVMTRTFAKLASDVRSAEYEMLQKARHDYPTFSVEVRTIKRNSNKKTYKNLTYDYMQKYIILHGTREEQLANMREFTEMKLIGECHTNAKAYATIKSWFLDKFPEIAEFGMIDLDTEKTTEESAAETAPAEEIKTIAEAA